MKAVLNKILKPLGLEQFGVLWGYFRSSGWRRSMLSKQAVDSDGRPVPWYCYPFIYFIANKLGALQKHKDHKDIRVFEYGSGNSTLWWADRVSEVVSVEDSPQWHAHVMEHKPANVTYHLAVGEEDYIGSIFSFDGKFDVVIIDGSHRDQCIRAAVQKLNDTGVLIIDNSERPSLQESLDWTESLGFRQLEFYGIGPINGHPWGTSLLYRDNNVLGI